MSATCPKMSNQMKISTAFCPVVDAALPGWQKLSQQWPKGLGMQGSDFAGFESSEALHELPDINY